MPSPHLSPAAAAASPTGMSTGLIVLILSMLLGIQPVTTDLYLPALPALTEGFGAAMSQAQLTLSALLLAFGSSQLIWGPLSDRFGRRPILLWGLTAYTLASIGSTLAPSMALLIVWRIVQGAAMGAVVMCARAIVRDLYHPLEGARVMSKGLSGLGVLACISAPLGGLLSELYGWRIALAALAVFGAAALALVSLRFEESLAQKNPNALQPATLFRTWLHIVRNPTFLAFSALTAASYGGLFTFLATSSFVFIKVLGLSKTGYGLVMFSMCFCYLAGTFICRRLLPRFGVRRSVAIAACLSLTAGTTMGVLALFGVQNVWAIMLPYYLFMLAHGVHQPCGQSGAVGPFPQAAGAASALNGFFMMLVAFAMGGWLGTHMDGTVRPLTHGIWLWSVLIATAAWTVVQKYGEPAHEAAAKP
ncbi:MULTISPECIES: multidrug effflux MFS transporter [unclassified Polaromonas]|uniref:multidrug effflux MFS transporter n=1 Tax=unclassified Polaromonas TaxID=2638319 RepID=UPI000F086551|nr:MULTISPECIES: multidrug effflux MFS transporter [unclassified Polaromonas]AYQ29042.1 MFS transporter [Polaromonas sp. SP1]QGJ19841.1 Bcr/CflA family efflux MFS transporter [Polaromonas sp. Pch-P]